MGSALIDRIQEEVKKGLEEQAKKAGYKIQITFRSDRSIHRPIAYTLSFWESGKRLHGGGDEMMWVCRRNEGAPLSPPPDVLAAKVKATPRGCDSLIPGSLASPQGDIVCPHCQMGHKTHLIGDSIFYRTSVDQCSHILADWWRKLDHNADIYAKFTPKDPRTIAMADAYGWRRARELKGLTIYPLSRIIQDTLAGATVESRFKSFITA